MQYVHPWILLIQVFSFLPHYDASQYSYIDHSFPWGGEPHGKDQEGGNNSIDWFSIIQA